VRGCERGFFVMLSNIFPRRSLSSSVKGVKNREPKSFTVSTSPIEIPIFTIVSKVGAGAKANYVNLRDVNARNDFEVGDGVVGGGMDLKVSFLGDD
jgi:hypothetical protein